jgi:hypothetical protein
MINSTRELYCENFIDGLEKYSPPHYIPLAVSLPFQNYLMGFIVLSSYISVK